VKQHERALLLSVRPRYAESIMNGSKTAEIRRQRPSVELGAPVIIYATQPVAAVVGSARIVDVHHGSPSDVWADHHDALGISQDEFDDYVAGVRAAYVLTLDEVLRLAAPLTLDEMRTASGFHPPRSYRYVTRTELGKFVNGHPGGDSLLSLLPENGILRPRR